jgi:hypothetical protein
MVKIKAINFKSLKELFNEMDNEKGMLGLALIKEAEFMKTTLTKLKGEMKKGVVTEMSQGKYSIDRANPALTQYNAMIKNYQSTIKQINDLLPKDTPEGAYDPFDQDDLS